MDLVPILYYPEHLLMGFYPSVVVWFGLCMLVAALITYIYDHGTQDYAFWLYLFGVLALWIGVSVESSNLLSAKMLYIGFNLLLIAVGTRLMCKVFLVFGDLGVLVMLDDLSRTIFRDSIGFPLSLTILGLLTIGI